MPSWNSRPHMPWDRSSVPQMSLNAGPGAPISDGNRIYSDTAGKTLEWSKMRDFGGVRNEAGGSEA